MLSETQRTKSWDFIKITTQVKELIVFKVALKCVPEGELGLRPAFIVKFYDCQVVA